MMKVSIIGAGYVGIVTGACLAEKGFYVTCVDIDKEKVEKINNCIPPIFENGLEDLLKKNVNNRRLIASTNLKEAVMDSEISIIAVGTPFDGRKIDLSYIRKVVEEIGAALKGKNTYHVIVVKSTVPPGTTNEVVLPILKNYSGKKAGVDFGVGVNPEFLREGCAVNDFMDPDRVVIGGIDKKTVDKILELFKVFDGIDVLITNNKTAEMIKYASNSLLATLISFSNEIANICALAQGVDIKEVMAGVHLDKRLNPILADGSRVNPGLLSYLEAGCGFGGSCLPKDVKALISYAESRGENSKLLRSVIEVNQEQPNKLIQLLSKHYKSFKNLNVAILGLAFKPDTDDMRESPAIPVVELLLQKGAHVKAYDPAAKEEAKKIFGTSNIEYPESLNEALLDVDAVILITRWKEFNDLYTLINNLKLQPLIIDGRRILNNKVYKRYEGVGLKQERKIMYIESCRICKSKKLERILDLGEMPLANAFLDKNQIGQKEIFYPLRAVWCESCGLLQIDEIVPPEILFRNYVYVSGTSEALRKHFEGLATEVVNNFKLNSESLVVDIGSNDGTLLKGFEKFRLKVIGVEPAVNIAKIAEENGIKTINDFFSEAIAKKIVKENGKADAVTATNVVAHTNNLDDLLKGVSYLLKDEGVFVIEVPYLVDLLENVEFDTIYHEHLSYFAVRPLKRLFEMHEFKIVNIEKVNMHGGTIRVFVNKKKSGYNINENVNRLVSLEIEKGLNEVTAYRKFAAQVEKLKEDLVGLLQKLKSENKKVIGYGAAAKGNTLLNYYHIGPELIEFIADLSPMKQNKFTPGTHIPVYAPERIYETKPDYILILAWNFADEIMKQQSKYKEMGGKFIIPIPAVKII